MANVSPDPWIPASAPLGWLPTAVQTYRVTPGTLPSSGPPTLTLALLPNLDCVAIQVQEGPDPGTAVFRYRFGGADSDSPQALEQALGTQYTRATLPDLVEIGDWLAVLATSPSGQSAWLFSGFPLEWEGALGEDIENVRIVATGVAKRLWDTPKGGARWRNSDAVETGNNDVGTALLCQFNPGGRPNASPSTGDSGSGASVYPVFMDPDHAGTDANSVDYPRTWDIGMAAALLLFTGNATENYASNPTRTDLQDLLVSREPIGGTPFDPTNASTYTAKPIQAPDAPLNGKALPILVHDLIKDSGFGMSFPFGGATSGAGAGPTCAFNLFLKQAGAVKSIYLATRFSPLDTSANNVSGAHLARDLSGVVNQWTIDAGLDRIEASFILSQAFPSQASDASSLASYKSTAAGFATGAAADAYRTFVLDESGEGHYAIASTTKVTTATSLDLVLGAPVMGVAQYVKRRRPPIGTLLSADTLGKRVAWKVSVSKAYAGAAPGVWDGTATDWQDVAGGVEVLKDRIGFRVNVQDPNAWNIGVAAAGPFKDGKVNLVELIAGGTAVYFRLTCVIEADQSSASYTAAPLGTSPIAQAIERRIDARDRMRKEVIYGKSEFNNTGTNTTARDDSELAKAEATAYRTATDSGVFEADVEIPYITGYYAIGDKIDQIYGRGLGFRTDAGGTGYLPVLPIVVGVRWDFDGGQRTMLRLSDAGLDRRQYARRMQILDARPRRHASPGARVARAAVAPAPAPAVGKATMGGGLGPP